jgi:hypothetical protein
MRDAITARISLESDTPRLSVSVDLDDLAGLPPEAEVQVDLYRRSEVESFHLGTVGDLRVLEEAPIERFADPTSALMRVKVTSPLPEDEGRLLAAGDKIRPEAPSNASADSRGLLPFRGSDALEEQLWRLEIGAEGPVVLMNSRLPSWNATARSTHFVALVYPEVMRQIARWVAEGLRDGETPESGGDALGDWMRFVQSLGISLDSIAPSTTDEEITDFADSCAEKFSNKAQILERFNQLMEVEE